MERKSGVALAVFVLLTTAVASYHEPWRDEADAWLMARDASIGDMLHIAGYAGTPILWYVIQAPLAKAGAPYAVQRYLHLVIASGAAAVLLFCAPFPFMVRLAVVFGYFLSFEYAVVARNYSSGILLCFSALSMDRQRLSWAPLYGLALGLAANASVHFAVFAMALVIPLGWHAMQDGGDRRVWFGVGLGLTGIGLAVWQLWPPVDGQLPAGLFTRFEPFRIPEAISQAFAPRAQEHEWRLVVGLAATGVVIGRLWHAPRAAVFFGLSCLGLGYVFVFKYASGVHHYGLFFIAVVMALWLAEEASHRVRASTSRLWERAFSIAMLMMLLPSLYIATRVWTREVKYAFSESVDMARFIQASHLDQARIAAHPPMGSVLALLPRRTFWYPALGGEASYMRWDARYRTGWLMPLDAAVVLMKEQCPGWGDPRDPVLLLVNTPLSNAEAEGYRLLYSTPGRPWLVEDETFYLYAPTSFDSGYPGGTIERRPSTSEEGKGCLNMSSVTGGYRS
jgi:hypothetical protein